MARIKRAVSARKSKRKIMKLAKGFFGSRKNLLKTANEAVTKALVYAYRDRKNRKREFRQLWIARINAAARLEGMSYSRFIAGLKNVGIDLDRKVLADIAVADSVAFKGLVDQARKGLEKTV